MKKYENITLLWGVNITIKSFYANDAKTFLKHFSDCLFYFRSTCADSITYKWKLAEFDTLVIY